MEAMNVDEVRRKSFHTLAKRIMQTEDELRTVQKKILINNPHSRMLCALVCAPLVSRSRTGFPAELSHIGCTAIASSAALDGRISSSSTPPPKNHILPAPAQITQCSSYP
jgi:hypothetical protein